MSVDRAAAWMYRGIWGALVRWFHVPGEPPTLPGAGHVESFRPAPGFLKYLKLWFWLALTAVDLGLLIAWGAVLVALPWLGVALAPVFLFVIVAPDIVAYIAIHLRYDTTWYVLTERSLRIRRGIWVIHEVTITYENIQNVTVRNGPVQRYYGIADVAVQTAGGGGSAGAHGGQGGGGHHGRIEGVADAERIRDLIMARALRSRSAGLGDEAHPERGEWSAGHIAALREVRDAAVALAR